MKKILAIILSCIMILGCVSTSALAADTPTITGSTASGKAGETVTVTMTLADNPGIATMTTTLSYDKTALTLKSATSDVYSVTSSTNLVLYMADGTNYTGNGVICTLTFQIADTAAAGDYTIGIKYRSAKNEAKQKVTITPTDGKITVQGDEPQPAATFDTANLSIGESLALTVNATVENITSPKIKFSMGSGEYLKEETDDMIKTAEGKYSATFSRITAERMAETLTMQILDDEGNAIATKTYSVKQYCKDLVESSAETLGMTDDAKAKLDILLANMLEYGAAAQVYASYDTENLANADSWVAEKEVNYGKAQTPLNQKSVVSSLSGSDKIASAYINLGRDVKIVFCVKSENPDTEKLVVYYGDKTEANKKTYKLGEAVEIESGVYRYEVVCDGMSATQFDEKLTAYLMNGDEVLHGVTYSVNSYNYAYWNTSNANLQSTVHWLYNFGVAAINYK